MNTRTALRLAALALPLLAADTSAQSVRITRIIDTNTTWPGGPQGWNSFGFPSVHDGRVAFLGFERYGTAETWMYVASVDGGPLTLVWDSTRIMPHNNQPFTFLWNPSLRGSTVMFDGSSTHQWDEGLYTVPATGGPLTVLLDPTIAAGAYQYGTFEGTWAVYAEGDASNPHTLWGTTGGSKGTAIATSGQTTPDGGTFMSFDPPATDAGFVAIVAFENRGLVGTGRAVYTYDLATGVLRDIQDFEDIHPGNGRPYTVFLDADTDGREIAFSGYTGFGRPQFGDQYALFQGPVDGTPEIVADLDDTMPGTNETWLGFASANVDDGLVAFTGWSNTHSGLFGRVRGGPVFPILMAGDLLDGKTVLGVQMRAECLHQSTIACLVDFTDFSRGVYTLRVFTLRVDGELTRGQPGRLRAAGAEAGETVYFLASTAGTGAGPCLPQLGGLCLGLLQPVQLLGGSPANASGIAEFVATVPAGMPAIPVSFQAVIQRGAGGVDSVSSNPVTAQVR